MQIKKTPSLWQDWRGRQVIMFFASTFFVAGVGTFVASQISGRPDWASFTCFTLGMSIGIALAIWLRLVVSFLILLGGLGLVILWSRFQPLPLAGDILLLAIFASFPILICISVCVPLHRLLISKQKQYP